MSKVSHLPKNVPVKEIPFKVKVKGSANKRHTYEGDFVVKVPSVREMGQIGIELAKLNDGIPLEMLDKNTAALHNAIAFLKVTLVNSPAWFCNSPDDDVEEGMDFGLDTMDVNVPVEIFKAANRKIEGWQEALRGQPEEASSEPAKG